MVGESGVVSRFEALHSGTTPLVGCDEELDLLLQRWQQAKSGEGRVVLVSGDLGIGKSRLTAALSQRIETEPHTRIRYFCSSHHQDSALYPPVLMISEDLHWIDPTSRELLDLTVEKITRLPVLLVATYPPEFQPPWIGGRR